MLNLLIMLKKLNILLLLKTVLFRIILNNKKVCFLKLFVLILWYAFQKYNG